MADNIEKGDEVSWKWGSANPSGTVSEVVTDGKAQVTSKKGNTATRIAKEGDPAIKISRPGNDVVKLAHELNEVKEGSD
ncbi:hypothetical protein PLICRDRAFT_179238 [Plicaturopsis crispa FD-325 SS-3]|uniref:Hypervirulence associated protein TUDOR domain-containing protein n=1 Tax=Plicaturopsis crispa FD-325 SS-3 TaxID=944288 RepID=A0A0C9SRQ1_PLICR|nr:hypothetical protein PLICRDRAFT_179238 [Plicaturopsis crispa FD-325 SS-3]